MAKPNILKARWRPESMGSDNFTTGLIELFNQDGSPYSGGGGGGSDLLVAGQFNPNVLGVEAYAVFNAGAGVEVRGMPESEGEYESILELPAGVYMSQFLWGFDGSVDEGAGDTTRAFRVWFQYDDPAPAQLVTDLMRFPDRPAGGWSDYQPNPETIYFPFVTWAPVRVMVSLATSTAVDGVDMTAQFMISKISDIPDVVATSGGGGGDV